MHLLPLNANQYLSGANVCNHDLALAPKLKHAQIALGKIANVSLDSLLENSPGTASGVNTYLSAMMARPTWGNTTYGDNLVENGWRKHVGEWQEEARKERAEVPPAKRQKMDAPAPAAPPPVPAPAPKPAFKAKLMRQHTFEAPPVPAPAPAVAAPAKAASPAKKCTLTGKWAVTGKSASSGSFRYAMTLQEGEGGTFTGEAPSQSMVISGTIDHDAKSCTFTQTMDGKVNSCTATLSCKVMVNIYIHRQNIRLMETELSTKRLYVIAGLQLYTTFYVYDNFVFFWHSFMCCYFKQSQVQMVLNGQYKSSTGGTGTFQCKKKGKQ